MDADTFVSWGVDYLKLDGCYSWAITCTAKVFASGFTL